MFTLSDHIDKEMSSPNQLNILDTVPVTQAQKIETVEGKLWGTFRALAEAEGVVYFLTTLKKLGLATNEVRSFVDKQILHKKMTNSRDSRVLNSAMRSKVSDACAYAKKLRQTKNILRNRVTRKYRDSKSKCRKILDDMVRRYRVLRIQELRTADEKVRWHKEKSELVKSFEKAPPHTEEILSGVNVFCENNSMVPQDPLGPFICDESLVFSDCELKLLAKGPKFMIRSEPTSEEFEVEIEKMVVKKKLDTAFNTEEDLSVQSLSEPSEPAVLPAQTKSAENGRSPADLKSGTINGNKCSDRVGDVNLKWEENVGKMVFNMQSNSLDLGNLQATAYKHNKQIFLPQDSESSDVESAHQTRRVELMRVFNSTLKGSSSKPNSKSNFDVDSNLTKDEAMGLKSLRKRIKNGSLVIADTDKSKRFACLSRDQYIASGMKHASKDIEISPSKVKRIQSTVNDHTWWFKSMSNCGSNWGHEDRMARNILDKGEQACPMVLLIKDHKEWSIESGEPPPFSPSGWRK